VAKKIVTDLIENKRVKEYNNPYFEKTNVLTKFLLSDRNSDIEFSKQKLSETVHNTFTKYNHLHAVELSKYLKKSFLSDFEFKSSRDIGTLGSFLKSKISVNLDASHKKIQNLISEEIATFAIEIIYNKGIELSEIIDSVEQGDDQNIIFEMIKKSKSTEAIKTNLKKLLRYKGQRKQVLLTSICINSLNEPDFFLSEVYPQLNNELDNNYTKCLLFEIAEKSGKYKSFLRDYLKKDGLDIVTRLICYYGLRDHYKKEALYEELETLIKQFIQSKQSDNDSLAVDIILEIGLKKDSSIEMLLTIINDSNAELDTQKRAASLLCSFYSPKEWKVLRGLQAKIKTKAVRNIIKCQEQKLKNVNSQEISKKSYSNSMRTELWKLI